MYFVPLAKYHLGAQLLFFLGNLCHMEALRPGLNTMLQM